MVMGPTDSVIVLRRALFIAAGQAFKSEVIDAQMWSLEVEALGGDVSKRQYRDDWIEDKVEEWMTEAVE